MTVELDSESWNARWLAGTGGAPGTCPPDVCDPLAFASGHAEGRAARERQKAYRKRAIAMNDMPQDLALSLLDPITNPEQIALDEIDDPSAEVT